MFKKIKYEELSPRQKENYNFQKIASKLADYGFNCRWLNDHWQGADFIACHISGNTSIKIQLTGRLTIDKKYNGKDIYVAFNQNNQWYLYPHDELQSKLLNRKSDTQFGDDGRYHPPKIPKNLIELMKQYII